MKAIKHLILLAALLVFCLSENTAAIAQSSVAQFQTEQAAQEHCPQDTVVWVNTNSGIYHFKGQRWYGNTKSGAYVCEQEADAGGDRATRNGQ